MSVSALPPLAKPYVPLRLDRHSTAFKAGAVLAATGMLAVCS